MNPSHIKRATAARCAVHQAVKAECADALVHGRGFFKKEQILDNLNYSSLIGDTIRWDYITDWIEEEYGIDVIGVASRFFKRQEELDKEGKPITLKTHPNRYRAGGNGRRTEGYASVVFEGASFLVIAKIKQNTTTAETLLTSNKKSRTRLTRVS